jgi:hypothetical protein
MSIRPIDIQTMLAQLSQVGKDQAAEKEGAALQASIQNAAELKRREEAKEAIRRAEDKDLNATPVDERKQKRGGPATEESAEAGEKEKKEEAPESDVVRDPDLGSHIDLTG